MNFNKRTINVVRDGLNYGVQASVLRDIAIHGYFTPGECYLDDTMQIIRWIGTDKLTIVTGANPKRQAHCVARDIQDILTAYPIPACHADRAWTVILNLHNSRNMADRKRFTEATTHWLEQEQASYEYELWCMAHSVPYRKFNH